jgi:hypothetical protein
LDEPPRSVAFTTALLTANAGIWLTFAILVLAGSHPSYPRGSTIAAILATLALAAAGSLALLTVMLRRRQRWAFLSTTAFLLLFSFLTIADEVGAVDLAVLAIELVPLALLVKDRRWYWRPSVGGST